MTELCMLIVLARIIYDEDIERAPYIRVKLKSVRHEQQLTADRTGTFVLLIYSLTASHQTAVHGCSTEAHLVPVLFHARLTCAWR